MKLKHLYLGTSIVLAMICIGEFIGRDQMLGVAFGLGSITSLWISTW